MVAIRTDSEPAPSCVLLATGTSSLPAKTATLPWPMELSQLFLLPDGRLRAGWRVLLFIIVFFLALLLYGWLVISAFPDLPLAANLLALVSATLSATWLTMRFVESQPVVALGLRMAPGVGSQITRGLLAGAAMAGGVALIEWASGLISFENPGVTAPSPSALITATALLLVAAANEEILFRGYAFQRLVEGLNASAAVICLSALFGLVHYSNNPHATPLGAINTVIAGVWLSLAYLRTRALWLPIALHFSWNWTLALIGLPVSGLDLMQTPWSARSMYGPEWLHGGPYGPEGGLIGTLALCMGIGYVVATTRPTTGLSPETALRPDGPI